MLELVQEFEIESVKGVVKVVYSTYVVNNGNRKIRKYSFKVVVLILLAILAGLHPVLGSDAYAAGSLTFRKLTDHPYASKSGYRQADGSVSAAGRAIKEMVVTGDGKLIAGYGDWGGNSDSWGVAEGRVGVVPYDIATDTWGGMTYSGSEAMEKIREINGALYIPTIDPSIHGIGGYLTNRSGAWQSISAVPEAVHILDIATSDGSDLLLFGSAEPGGLNTATIWRSTDGGSTWSIAMTDANSPGPGDWERYYWGLNLNGKVYTQASQVRPQAPIRSFDGSSETWDSDNNISINVDSGYDTISEVFDGRIVKTGPDGMINTFDGTNVGTIKFANTDEGSIKDFYVDNGYLYVLNESGVYRTNSLTGLWQKIASVSSDIQSIAVYQDKLYLGDNNGSIWVSDTNISETIEPIVTCFQFSGGTITGYYDYENNNSSNAACSREVVIPSSIGGITVESIAPDALADKSITKLYISDSVTSISDSAFSGNNISELVIPNSVTNIGKEAFMDNNLTSLSLGSGLTNIGENAFANNAIKSLSIPDSVSDIGKGAFRKNAISSLRIGSGINAIPPAAFSYNQLESVVIPDSVIYIGCNNTCSDKSANVDLEGSFEGNQLASLTMGDSLLQIIGPAFAANKITSVTLPTTVSNVSSKVFSLQNPIGGNIVEDSGVSSLSQLMSAPADIIQEYLDTLWYVRLYTKDSTNPNKIKDGIQSYHWENGGTNYGGFVVNPASVKIEYVDDSGTKLIPSITRVGDGLLTYLVKDNPFNYKSSTAKAAAAARYYRIGDSPTITAPIISGYSLLTSASASKTALSSSSNTVKFIYTKLASGSVSNTDKSESGGYNVLGDTGDNEMLIIGLSLLVVGVSVFIALRLRQYARY